MTPYFLRREKGSVLGRASAAAAGTTESGGAAAGTEEAAAAAAAAAAGGTAGAMASAAPRVPSLGHKHDLIVWVKLTAPQRRLYLTFLSSASVRNALNKVRGSLPKVCRPLALATQKRPRLSCAPQGACTRSRLRRHCQADSGVGTAAKTKELKKKKRLGYIP